MSTRIDIAMVENKLVNTRSQARMLIKQGDVLYSGKLVSKPGQMIDDVSRIEITQDQLYVSRGAYKLLRAIEEFDLSVEGKVVADCGASTGGFTEVLLNNNVAKVYAIDVGKDQLSPKIKSSNKVVNLEGVNLRYEYKLPELVDFCVCDISFISLKHIFPTMKKLLKPNGKMVLLIKPQFEAGPERIGKGGIVDEKTREIIYIETINWIENNGGHIINTCKSPISGKEGNVEYLALVE